MPAVANVARHSSGWSGEKLTMPDCASPNCALKPPVSTSTASSRSVGIASTSTGFLYCVSVVGITGELGVWKPEPAAFRAVLDRFPGEAVESQNRFYRISRVPVRDGSTAVVAVARLTWARCDQVRLVAEFAESELVSQLATAEQEPWLATELAWPRASPECCEDDPDRRLQRHSDRIPVPRVLNRRPQLFRSASDSAH